MTRKDLTISDPQIITQPITYESKSSLTARCHQCPAEITTSLGNYWKRKRYGPWLCTKCQRLEKTAKSTPPKGSRKYVIQSDPLVIKQPETYRSDSKLTARCDKCETTIETTVETYWANKKLNTWSCNKCKKLKKDLIASDQQIIRRLNADDSKLLVSCIICKTEVEILPDTYWKRRRSGPWTCIKCSRLMMTVNPDSRKAFIMSDPQVVAQPLIYDSSSQLTARCRQCNLETSIAIGPYWRRRKHGPWICFECLKPQIIANSRSNPLYDDSEYCKQFADLHKNPEYAARVHNGQVNHKIAESQKIAWLDGEKRQRHMRYRISIEFSGKRSIIAKRSWQTNRNKIVKQHSDNFKSKAEALHGNKYDYDKVTYTNHRTKIILVCSRCDHQFSKLPNRHLRSGNCPKCDTSQGQMEIYEYLNGFDRSLNDRIAIKPYEIDIFIPELKIGIEFHGVYWHSYNEPETKQQRERHQAKAIAARNAGIKLLQFYDYEWYKNGAIVRSIIDHKTGKSNERYNARSLNLIQLTDPEARTFFHHNHLSGHRCAAYTISLAIGNDPIMAMSLSKDRPDSFEIIRMATKLGCSVRGGVARLVHHAKKLCGTRINTYSDLRYSFGECYAAVGFNAAGITPPGYFYHKNGIRLSRLQCQKHKLEKLLGDQYDPSRSEVSNMFSSGYRRCWTAGNLRWVST